MDAIPTRRLTVKNQPDLLNWAAHILGTNGWMPDSEAIGVLDRGKIRAVFVLNSKQQGGCSIHIASDGSKTWAAPSIFGRLCEYGFTYKKLTWLRAAAPVDNIPVQVLLLKLGFKVEGRLRAGAVDGSDAILFSIFKGECELLKGKDNG